MNDISASDKCVTVITAFSGSLWLRWARSSKLTEPVLNLFRKKAPSNFVFSQCITNTIFAGSRLMFTTAKKTTFSSRKLCWGTSLFKHGPSKLYFALKWERNRIAANHCNYWIFSLGSVAILSHMGQFLQGGKNGRLMSFFFKSRASVRPNLMR